MFAVIVEGMSQGECRCGVQIKQPLWQKHHMDFSKARLPGGKNILYIFLFKNPIKLKLNVK